MDFNVESSGLNIKVRSRSWDFNVRSSGSNMEFRSRSPPSPATHCLVYFFRFFFFYSFFCFFSTQKFEASFDVQCSPLPLPPRQPHIIFSFFFFSFFFSFSFFCFFFPRQTSKPDFKVPTSNFEVGTLKSGFKVQCFPPPPSPLPRASHPLFFFSCFFLFLSFVFFPRQTSKPDFKVPTSKPDFNVPTSNFEVRTLKSGFKVQTWNLEHLWELHGRAHPPTVCVIQ